MIRSREDYRRYLEADLAAIVPNPPARWRLWHRWQYPTTHFQRHLRHVEYLVNCRRGRFWTPIVLLARLRLRRHAIKLGFTIPPNVFGPGLAIVHWGTIVVNDRARFGAGCRIHPGTSIGLKNGAAPTVGERCYVGPGAKLFGGITLGDDVSIGANAVVTRSFGDGAILVGIPAVDRRRVGDQPTEPSDTLTAG